jgi:4-amino-4-deoxy-L-arabinose transferase-like glycosyltransferase
MVGCIVSDVSPTVVFKNLGYCMRKSIATVNVSSDRLILMAIISIAISIQIIWLRLDRSVPSWDDASHLTNALNYQKVISHIQLFSADWWQELWAQSPSYTAPFIYILTVPFLSVFGRSVESGILVNTLFIIIIVATTYALSKTAFNHQISLWASGLCLLFPALLNVQMMYLLDDGIVAISCLTFLTLTHWKNADTRSKSWQWCLIFGIVFGCLMLSKPTGFLFLLLPSLLLLGSLIKHRNWLKIFQFGLAITISWLIYGSWFSQNWLTVITSAVSANGMGIAEGDPGGNTLAGWLYYIRLLPELISLPILVSSMGLLMLWLFSNLRSFGSATDLTFGGSGHAKDPLIKDRRSIVWLLVYCLGGYIFCSLATNKDSRFILPIFPILGIFISCSLNLFQTNWARTLRWMTVGITGLIVISNLFVIPGTNNLLKIPYLNYSLIHKTQLESKYPHQELVQEIVSNHPYLRSTIGVLASSRDINAENLNLYGALANFQVYARYFVNSGAKEPSLIEKDLKFINWYVTKTGENGYINKNILPAIEQNPHLEIDKTWQLADQSIVKLYRRKDIPVLVQPLNEDIQKIQLEKVIISPSSNPAINTTYQLSGNRDLLQNGLLILTWHDKDLSWNHDRAIGLDKLYLDRTTIKNFRVVENSAMLPPGKLALSEYQLTATYLNRKTGETFPLIVPPIEIQPATTNHSFEPDAISKLQQLAKLFARGKIDPVFAGAATLNQYDPTQDYLTQARQAIDYRIKRGESQLDLKYTLALTQVLQRQIEPLLANLTQITQADPLNPSAWIYLGFIRLYHWQPQAAETAFQIADELPSPPPELSTLKIVSSLFRFDLVQAWQRWQSIPKPD